MSSAGGGDHQRSLKRLMKELSQLHALERQGGCRKLNGFHAAPLDEADLYTWELSLYDFEEDQEIASDMRARQIDHLTLRMLFPLDYPNSPPFVYMLRPRLKESTGYVLGGGGICMELLTPSEWSPATSINALVMSVRGMLIAGKIRLKSTSPTTNEPDYVLKEAQRDFAHILKVHDGGKWTQHPKFRNA